jgi:hypothetical protein
MAAAASLAHPSRPPPHVSGLRGRWPAHEDPQHRCGHAGEPGTELRPGWMACPYRSLVLVTPCTPLGFQAKTVCDEAKLVSNDVAGPGMAIHLVEAVPGPARTTSQGVAGPYDVDRYIPQRARDLISSVVQTVSSTPLLLSGRASVPTVACGARSHSAGAGALELAMWGSGRDAAEEHLSLRPPGDPQSPATPPQPPWHLWLPRAAGEREDY